MDVLGMYVGEFGIELGYGMDSLGMDVLMKGKKGDGCECGGVIGVYERRKGISYKELLDMWVGGGGMGGKFSSMIGGEDEGMEMLKLGEFKEGE